MTWFHKLRLRAFAIIAGVSVLIVIGLGSIASVPLWALIGAVVGTVVLTIHTMAARLDSPTCLACGKDLAKEPAGEYGLICPKCGSISLPRTGGHAASDEDDSADDLA